jgi:hypothetical protein
MFVITPSRLLWALPMMEQKAQTARIVCMINLLITTTTTGRHITLELVAHTHLTKKVRSKRLFGVALTNYFSPAAFATTKEERTSTRHISVHRATHQSQSQTNRLD